MYVWPREDTEMKVKGEEVISGQLLIVATWLVVEAPGTGKETAPERRDDRMPAVAGQWHTPACSRNGRRLVAVKTHRVSGSWELGAHTALRI